MYILPPHTHRHTHTEHPFLMGNLESHMYTQINMYVQKKPEKTISFHFRLIASLVQVMKDAPAQRKSAKTGKSVFVCLVFGFLFISSCHLGKSLSKH